MRPPGTGPPDTRSGSGRPSSQPTESRHRQARASVASALSVTPRADRAALLAVSRERDLQLRLRLAAWREGYRAGWEHGWRAGYEAADCDQAASWAEVAKPKARSSGRDLERRRWAVRGEPRTRAEFGQPDPADHPGQGR